MSLQGSQQGSLQQQIQEEIQREAKIDKRIENIKKKFLKQQANRKYRVVSTRKEANAILLFDRTNLTKFDVVLNNESNEFLRWDESNPRYTRIYLKNKNPHDAKISTYGDIKNVCFAA